MKKFDTPALRRFYDDLSNADGIRVETFIESERELFTRARNYKDVEDYRLGKKPWKKLRDEIVPVSTFLRSMDSSRFSLIRFPLNDQVPDCWITDNSDQWQGIEVTIERGRERFHLAQELNSEGVARGFMGLQDDAKASEFIERMEKPRTAYNSQQALEATKAGILRCLERKDDQDKYASTRYLLIESSLKSLPKDRWQTIVAELRLRASSLPFSEIFVLPVTSKEPWCIQLKP